MKTESIISHHVVYNAIGCNTQNNNDNYNGGGEMDPHRFKISTFYINWYNMNSKYYENIKMHMITPRTITKNYTPSTEKNR